MRGISEFALWYFIGEVEDQEHLDLLDSMTTFVRARLNSQYVAHNNESVRRCAA